MSGCLVDTNVISEGAPGRANHTPEVLHWMRGKHRVAPPREAASRKAARLSDWLESVLHLYGDRVLPIDVGVARIAGGISGGQAPGFADVAIAATAHVHGLTVLTRNIRRFVPLGVAVRDPFVQT